MSKFETLVEIFSESTKRYAQSPLFGEKRDGEWKWMTYGAFKEKVDNLRGGLAGLGVKPGDRVAAQTEKSVEALVLYLATVRAPAPRVDRLLTYGLVIAFIFTTISTYIRFKDLELRYARLARAVALQNARPPAEDPAA